ncbi:Solute carrier family 35 member F2 [Fasciola hepatica]|uniref:Solute carrier family 35 member F2 n=1 Tax=Fasciola hepatica TaxID=6192 RepID=A0A2H1CMS2_FASHE|nr:Solute carrier family 35 member F2 [Fasciola hepatica]
MQDTVKKLNGKKEYVELSSCMHSKIEGCRRICGGAKHVCLILFVGQILAGLLGLSAVCAAMLSRLGFSLPLIQNIPHYLLLFLVFGTVRLCLRGLHPRPEMVIPEGKKVHFCSWPVLYYLMAGCVDLHAFWATLAAYAYTNVTSIQLLDCLGIPTSMVLSYFLLSYRYAWTHYLGAGICLFGAVLMIGADILAVTDQTTEFSAKTNITMNSNRTQVLFGDLLAVVGAILYGMSSVLQEHLTYKFGAVSYLTWFSLIGALFGTVYSLILEHGQLSTLIWTGLLNGKNIPMISLLYYFGYALSMFTLDFIMAFTIHRISAVFINLSLLSADIWGLLAGIWLFQVQFHYLYFASFFLIIAGASLFAIRNAKSHPVTIHE